MDSNHLEETIILESITRGDYNAAFNRLVKHYGPLLYQVIFHTLKSDYHTKDVLQNVFIKAFKRKIV